MRKQSAKMKRHSDRKARRNQSAKWKRKERVRARRAATDSDVKFSTSFIREMIGKYRGKTRKGTGMADQFSALREAMNVNRKGRRNDAG